ncbi:hypothetical protein [Desulfurobacterium atlanticum]|uniref:Lipoprotein n=1 Tax=Desulfurobacterium atlanticum TaxID=240169 RepID=A0A238ZSE8_9BACT|nr:hypothetical protein [Desulfurobacterium atlanticum]SNR86270.1 hypothetical protein SAMN06265340_11144 [Desulfurobacterium atlanticum]
MKKQILTVLVAGLVIGCAPEKAEVKTNIQKEPIVIKPEIKKVTPKFFIGKVLSIAPLKNKRGFYVLKVKTNDGIIYNIQIDSRYLIKGLTTTIGDTLRIYGYSPYSTAVVPFKISSVKTGLFYYYTPYWKTNPPKR